MSQSSKILDVYDNDLTKIVEQRLKDRMARKLVARQRYLRQHKRKFNDRQDKPY